VSHTALNSPGVDVRREDALTATEADEIARWTDVVFGPQPYVIAPMEWRILLRLDGQLVSHVGVMRRVIQVGDTTALVGGIGWVGTLPGWCSRGLAALAMRRATDLIRDELKADFGFLLCHAETVGFYHKLGWTEVAAQIVFDQPGGRIDWPHTAMVWECGSRAWPAGAIDLRGMLW
jgi:hypothetical protein